MSDGIGKRTELAKELIVREIWNRGAKQGDRLPSCGTLSKKLNLGRATVFRAVKKLQEEGILLARDRVGVFIADPKTPGRVSYQIGLLIGNMNSSPFNNLMSIYLQNHCNDKGCRCLMFHPAHVLHQTALEDSLSAHLGVRQQIERGELHGLLTQLSLSEENRDYLEKHRIPYCFAGGLSPNPAHLSVVISLPEVTRMGSRRLSLAGCRNPSMLAPEAEQFSEAAELFKKMTGGTCVPYQNLSDLGSLAQKILRLPPKKRPDGFLIPDDLVAQLFYSALIRQNGSGYLPHAVILAPAEQLLPFPGESEVIEFSVMELARRAVGLLLENIRNYSPERQEIILPLKVGKNVL
ncbi:MAG: Bacterial regulatory proteins, gntR family [Lentisphaerae bacterium ADurb.Bin242]|nr:MAG: Bacterial regulatory proteins, gntR family [Lentisphaerae bacterium ADurb.Bin242]